MAIEIATIFWIQLIVVGLLMAFLLGLLILFGSPHPMEPRWIRAMRFNMWAETIGLLGHGWLHPGLFSYKATKVERKMPLPGDELVPMANEHAT
jgi:hypothetical protein